MEGGTHMARNELAFSKEAAELISKALGHYVANELLGKAGTAEEIDLAMELFKTFKEMYK